MSASPYKFENEIAINTDAPSNSHKLNRDDEQLRSLNSLQRDLNDIKSKFENNLSTYNELINRKPLDFRPISE